MVKSVSASAFLVCFGLAMLFAGAFIGEEFGRLNWSDGYKTGYKKCEIDFWFEHRVHLTKK